VVLRRRDLHAAALELLLYEASSEHVCAADNDARVRLLVQLKFLPVHSAFGICDCNSSLRHSRAGRPGIHLASRESKGEVPAGRACWSHYRRRYLSRYCSLGHCHVSKLAIALNWIDLLSLLLLPPASTQFIIL